MSPNTIVSAHRLLSTLPDSERVLSTCYMPTENVAVDDVSFRVLVRGSVVYEGKGSPARPTCIRLPYVGQIATGDEIRVQALVGDRVQAEDVYVHEDIGGLNRAVNTVSGVLSGISTSTLLFLALVGFLVWMWASSGDEDTVRRRRFE